MQADQWSQQARAQPGAVADAKLLAEMQAMGFAGSGAAQALVQTGNTGVQQAVNWLFENPQDAHEQPMQPQPAPPRAESRPETPVVFSAQDAGIGGILRRQQEEAEAADSTLKVAFADLKNLEESAKEVVALAERFRSTLSRRDDGSIDGADGEAQAAMQEELLSMGIADPVTKDTAGKKYYQQLARQLDEFLVKPLERAGGMMTMQEVFCLFNRARGTELITPHDLTEAVSRLQKVGSPLIVKAFDSGVKVVCSASLDNEKVLEGLLKLVKPQEGLAGLGIGITERDAAKALNLSLMVAREHILTAENQGLLCRDDSPEGLRFFRNFFLEVAV